MPNLEIIFKTKAELAGAIAAKEALEHQLGAAKALGQHAAAVGRGGPGQFLADLGEQALKAIPGLEAAAGALAKLARVHQRLTAQTRSVRIAGENQREATPALENQQNILALTTPTHTGEQPESAPADATAIPSTSADHDLPRQPPASHRQEFQGSQPPEPAAPAPGLDPRPAEEQSSRGVPAAAVSQAIQSAADAVTGELQDLRQQLQAFFADMTKTLSAIQDDVKAAQDWIATHLS